ncbi:snRNA-activating protein complex subunit 3 isoform X2 [Scyliorhinus torazame]|uniref:snRNA-activating protein complex subunit 3 isoform X2 n=1 Tax=Scyliorhinus torazame TaxID=75743 RepID=UPI003B5AA3A0
MAAGPSGTGAAGASSLCRIPDYELLNVNSKVFCVGSFGSLWREKLEKAHLGLQEGEEAVQVEQQLATQLDLPSDMVEELQLVCGVDTLKCTEEETNTEVIPEDTELVTLAIRRKVIEKREARLVHDRTCRQETFDYEHEMQTVGRKPSHPEDSIAAGEVILTINVYSPIIFIKDLYKSAFFFFEGTFYNDARYSECRDLSRNVIEWAESHDRGCGKFSTAKMEDYTFNDMCIKVGYPYLYCHQGDCEHLIIISDVRIVHRDDCLDKTLYPCVTKKPWMWTRKCSVCKLFIVRWVTNNDSFAPEDPSFFCDMCFRMLHYDADGNKMGVFLAYPYVDPGIFN